MQDIQLKNQNFDRAKIALRNFSNNLPKTPELQKFKEDALWGAVSKNVTGKEMNEFIAKVQELFIESNKTSIEIIKEFKEVYNAFEVLDTEYIDLFHKTIGNVEVVSNNAYAASHNALIAQKDITRTIQAVKATIEKLNEFKNTSSNKVENIEHRLFTLENTLEDNVQSLKQIKDLQEYFENLNHLNDINIVGDDVQVHASKINEGRENIISLYERNEKLEVFSAEIASLKNNLKINEKILNKKLMTSYFISVFVLIIVIVLFFLKK